MEETMNISDVYKKLKEIERTMATKQEVSQAIETILVLSNEDTMNQIISSENDIKDGRFKEINSSEDL